MLTQVSADDILPGISELLDALEVADICMAVGSASKNARTVLEALGISHRFDCGWV